MEGMASSADENSVGIAVFGYCGNNILKS